MKQVKTVVLAVMATLLAGCVGEDHSFCPPPGNVTLHYRLPEPGGVGKCSFLEHVSTVKTAIYDDATGELVRMVTTTDDDHKRFKGLKLNLAPGKYRLVSWGNPAGATRFDRPGEAYTAGANILYNSVTDDVAGNGDPLYYAPSTIGASNTAVTQAGEYIMEIDRTGNYEGTLDFRHAHRYIGIFVKGFEYISESGSMLPLIRLKEVPPGLTFVGMNEIVGARLITSEMASEKVTVNFDGTTETYALSPFNVFYLATRDYDIGIELIDPATGRVLYTTKLNEHIDPAKDDPVNKRMLHLLIELFSENPDPAGNDVSVKVSIPGWTEQNVDYGWGD